MQFVHSDITLVKPVRSSLCSNAFTEEALYLHKLSKEILVTLLPLSLCTTVDENKLNDLAKLVCWDPGVVICFSRNYRDKVKVIFSSLWARAVRACCLSDWKSPWAQEQPQRSTTIEGIFPYIICSRSLKYSMFMGDIFVGVQQGPALPRGLALLTM